MDTDQIVRDFCAAWGRADLEYIMGAFTDDAVYHNIPMPMLQGKAEIENFIKGFLATNPDGVAFAIKQQIASGAIVFNERVDSFTMGDKEIAAPVCGVFELTADGKIAAWRDYFDMGHFTGASGSQDEGSS